MLRDGLLTADGAGWRRIPLAAVEALAGRRITAEEYLAAERRQDRERDRLQHYNQFRRHPAGTGADRTNDNPAIQPEQSALGQDNATLSDPKDDCLGTRTGRGLDCPS